MGGGNKDRGLKARGPLAPNTNPEEAQQEKEQAAEAQYAVVAHSPAGQGGASVEAASLTLTHPQALAPKKAGILLLPSITLAKRWTSLATLGPIRAHHLVLRSWVLGLSPTDSSRLSRLGMRASEPSLLFFSKREQNEQQEREVRSRVSGG